MPEYDHECYECQYAWQDIYSVYTEPPTVCPECGGKARRVILGAPSVKVLLTGQELTQNIKQEREKLREQVKKDENLRANLMGEEKYNTTQNNIKKLGEDLKQIT